MCRRRAGRRLRRRQIRRHRCRHRRRAGNQTGLGGAGRIGELDCDWFARSFRYRSVEHLDGALGLEALVEADEAYAFRDACAVDNNNATVNKRPANNHQHMAFTARVYQ